MEDCEFAATVLDNSHKSVWLFLTMANRDTQSRFNVEHVCALVSLAGFAIGSTNDAAAVAWTDMLPHSVLWARSQPEYD